MDQAEGENMCVCARVCRVGLVADSHQNQTGLCQRDLFPPRPKLQNLHPKLEVGVCNPLCGCKSMRPTRCSSFHPSTRFSPSTCSPTRFPSTCSGNVNFCTMPSLGSPKSAALTPPLLFRLLSQQFMEVSKG